MAIIIVLTILIHLEQKIWTAWKCKHHDYCYTDIPEKGKNILKYKHGEKSIKIPFAIYVDTQSLLEKLDTCYNKRKSSTTKVNKQTACG